MPVGRAWSSKPCGCAVQVPRRRQTGCCRPSITRSKYPSGSQPQRHRCDADRSRTVVGELPRAAGVDAGPAQEDGGADEHRREQEVDPEATHDVHRIAKPAANGSLRLRTGGARGRSEREEQLQREGELVVVAAVVEEGPVEGVVPAHLGTQAQVGKPAPGRPVEARGSAPRGTPASPGACRPRRGTTRHAPSLRGARRRCGSRRRPRPPTWRPARRRPPPRSRSPRSPRSSSGRTTCASTWRRRPCAGRSCSRGAPRPRSRSA